MYDHLYILVVISYVPGSALGRELYETSQFLLTPWICCDVMASPSNRNIQECSVRALDDGRS